MADSAVSFLLDNMSQLLAREASLLFGVKDRVTSLRNELQMIDAFLKTSERKQSKKDPLEQVVVDQIKDVAHEAEDVIDTFVTNMTMHKRRSKLGRMLHGVDNVKLRRDVAEKIDSIKATIIDIRENKLMYDSFQQEIESSSGREEEERVQLLHKRRRNVEEDDVVGFVLDSKEVIKRLMDEDSRSNVVSVIGMGGLGKTTLARKVYNSNEVKGYFSHRAWVYVSNECRVKELLIGLLKCLMPKSEIERRIKEKDKIQKGTEEPRDLISSLSEDDLKEIVQESLKRKRYLLVLDDLWKTQDWDDIKGAFPKEDNHGKILITSRLKEVASHTSQDSPFDLKLLSDEESWELFSKRVFRGEACPSDLETLGKQIVRSCRGLPLSINVLAGLLAKKEKSHREWSKVVGHVNWYLTRDETQVKDIVLELSYNNLPRRLKPCFLYLGIFPEDSQIPVRPLLQRWVAEGFIQQTGTRYPEDVAEDYLYELIDRSLVQAAQVNRISGGVKICRMHDLLRDLCISKNREEKVFEVCTYDDIPTRTKPRRLSVHSTIHHYLYSSGNDHSCVRSLLYFGPSGYDFPRNEWKWLFKYFKLVRVLDLGAYQVKNIPSNLGLFVHLRYLRIRSYCGRIVPDSIYTLENLQTLDIIRLQKWGMISFPGGLWKLKQLRHVYTHGLAPIVLRGSSQSVSDDEVMRNLGTISSIALNKQTAYLLENVKFPKLRKLGLQISPARKGKLCKLLRSLQQLRDLNKLGVSLKLKDFKGQIPSDFRYLEWHFGCKPQELLEELLQSLQQLTLLSTLKIYNALDLPTCDVAFPQNLTKLTLLGISCMNGGGMNALGNLPRLQILRLAGSSSVCSVRDSFELDCVAVGFPQLQELGMRELNIHNWKLASGVMPYLQSLVIEDCTRLVSLPNELWSLTALRQVRLCRPSDALSLALRKLETKDGCELTIENNSEAQKVRRGC